MQNDTPKTIEQLAEAHEWVTLGDGYADISLRAGLTIDGAKVNALRMREPSVNDQLAAETVKGSDADREVTLMANLCSVTAADIRALKLRDFKRVQLAFLGFAVE